MEAMDLMALYKAPHVNHRSRFHAHAAALDPAALARAYARAMEDAPRRADVGKRYFVDHRGNAGRPESSNRREERLAADLFRRHGPDAPLALPDGRSLALMDYQLPLKAARRARDRGRAVGLLLEFFPGAGPARSRNNIGNTP